MSALGAVYQGLGGPPPGWLPGPGLQGKSTILHSDFPTQMPLLAPAPLHSSNSCLPDKKFHPFKALSLSIFPQLAFNTEDTELKRILEVIFHHAKAQSHEAHLLPFVFNLDKHCPREVFVCVLPSGDCGYWASKHNFVTWGSTHFRLCSLPSSTDALDNLGPSPAYPVYTHSSERCTQQSVSNLLHLRQATAHSTTNNGLSFSSPQWTLNTIRINSNVFSIYPVGG